MCIKVKSLLLPWKRRGKAFPSVSPKVSTNGWWAGQPCRICCLYWLCLYWLKSELRKPGSLRFLQHQGEFLSDNTANATCRCHTPGKPPCRDVTNPYSKAQYSWREFFRHSLMTITLAYTTGNRKFTITATEQVGRRLQCVASSQPLQDDN